ncbi:MAG TPA: hypothetical protein VF541_21215 [Longimicrobium sp.]|jgi:metal-responsive CopG/Arc/MetJ family transcriptional regulator
MKTAISVPNDVFTAADALAGRLGMSRSELYATAVAEFLAKHSAGDITARINKVYATESSTLDPEMRTAQRRTLGRQDW